jgi:hypothetical protein
VSNENNLHIQISESMVKLVQTGQTILRDTGRILFVISLIATGTRVIKAVYDEITIEEEIQSLEKIISALDEDMSNENGLKMMETKKARNFFGELLEKARENKSFPGKKTLDAIVCIGAEYSGGALGAKVGAQIGTMIGTVVGPVGSIAGSVVGSIVGATFGSERTRSAIQNLKCNSKNLKIKSNL